MKKTNLLPGAVVHNFTLQTQRFIPDVQSHVSLWRHNKTGCRIVALKNDDNNKAFTVAFQTLPHDSTGVAHIIEHAVLSGSKKYPVKNLFEELIKRGLMTFLNAMTGSDITLYPFATRNATEYYQLMDVYLDVTLNPLLKEDTFLQEGWHLELLNPTDPLTYKGIVYNEMKGVYANPFRLISMQIFRALLPGSTYIHDSGGNPEDIPNLSYDEFKQFFKTHYHPSNAVIGVYGDAPIEEELHFLDSTHLDHFDAVQTPSGPKLGQIPDSEQYIKHSYGIHESEGLNEKTYLTIATAVSDASNLHQNMAFDIIGNLLYGSDASPLKQSILSAGIGKDVAGGYYDHNYQTAMVTTLVGSEEEHLEQFIHLYRDTLRDIVNQGFPRDLVVAELNAYEFSQCEEANDQQRGLNHQYHLAKTLFYNLDPFESLEFTSVFNTVRQKTLDENYLEVLIEKYLLDSPHTVFVTTTPDPEQQQRTMVKKTDRLEAIRAELTPDELNGIITKSQDLILAQQTPNTAADLKYLPGLTRSDLPPAIDTPRADVIEIQGRPFYSWSEYAHDISYIQIGLDLSDMPIQYLPHLKWYGHLTTQIGTSAIDYRQVAQETARLTGGFYSAFRTHTNLADTGQCRPILWFGFKALRRYLPEAIKLITKLITEVSFHDKDRIRQILERDYTWSARDLQGDAEQVPRTRLRSYLSRSGLYQEMVNGITAYFALKETAQDYDNREEELLNRLTDFRDLLLRRDRLLYTATGSAEDLEYIAQELGQVTMAFSDTPVPQDICNLPAITPDEAFLTASEVVYTTQGGNLHANGIAYDGHLEVLNTILSREYLINRIRIQGGAYGAWSQLDPFSGDFTMSSYRDPNISETFAAYDALPEYVQSLHLEESELEQIIIRTYGHFDALLTPEQRGIMARNNVLSGVTASYRNEILEQIKNTTPDDLRAWGPRLAKMLGKGHRSIIGNSAKIRQNAELFSKLIEV